MDDAQKSDAALIWLLEQFQAMSLHMDGPSEWRLPSHVNHHFRTRTPLEAIKKAYEEAQQSWQS